MMKEKILQVPKTTLIPVSTFIRRYLWLIIGISIITFFLTIAFYSKDVQTRTVGWEKSFYVSPYNIQTKNVKIAARGNLIAIVYEGMENKKNAIYVSISFDGGDQYLQPIKIADTSTSIDQNPHIAISSNGHIAVVWQSIPVDDPNTRLFYTYSTDMGATWNDPTRLYLPSETELLPGIYYDNRNFLHLFYCASKDESFNLFHIVSKDEKIFKPPEEPLVKISRGLRGAFFPTVLFLEEYIYIVWQGKEEKEDLISDDLFFISSSNYGDSFSERERITKGKFNDGSPCILLHKDIIYLVYHNNQDKNWAIKLLKGFDRGETWDKKPITISSTNADCYSPKAVISNTGDLVITWHDTGEIKPRVFARKYSIREKKLSPIAMLSNNRISARNPVSISIKNKVIVVWDGADRVTAKYSDVHVDPPKVYSLTHPEGKWLRSPNPQIEWTPPKDESGIVGYATFINNLKDFDPTIQNYDRNIKKIRIPDLENGITYFHIRAIDGAGNYSRTKHYKFQISKNPLPMPVISSTTHPEGKAEKSRNPIFQWSLDESIRLKGFVYSISKNTITKPDKFTTDFKTEFKDLEMGRYFFNIRSVDKTNLLSRIASYEIIVEKAEEIDTEAYNQIAKGIYKEPKKEKIKKVIKKKPKPSVDIIFPFDISHNFNESSFDVQIETKNINEKMIIGYSMYLGNEMQMPADRINQNEKTIKISDIKSGEHFLGIKCRYYIMRNKKKKYYWTDPIVKKFSIQLPPEVSPVLSYMDSISNRIAEIRVVVSVSLMALIVSIATGFGTKLSFYTRLFQSRINRFIRML